MVSIELRKKVVYTILLSLSESLEIITFISDDSVDMELMFSISTYIAENEDTLNLVEGERVYVIGEFKRFHNKTLFNYICYNYI